MATLRPIRLLELEEWIRSTEGATTRSLEEGEPTHTWWRRSPTRLSILVAVA